MAQPKGTALVVDDFDDGRDLLSALLTEAGYEVIEAANGTDTIAHIEDAPDLILLDVQLPDLDGFEVCRRIRADARTARTPIIMVSAVFSRTEHRVRGLHGGADAYLPKPYEPELLLATVESLMRHSVSERALLYRSRLLRLEFELTRMLTEPACVTGDTTAVLRVVAETLDAEMAEFWRVEPGAGTLVRAGGWHSPEIDGMALDRAAEGMRITCGIDAVGTLSESGAGEWREALATHLSASRVAAAELAGLRSATVVPVLARDRIAGAFVLFHRRTQRPDEDARRLVVDVRDRIWRFLERPGAAQSIGLVGGKPETGTFTTNRLAVHELRNLLFVIGGHAELLMETLPAEVPRRQDLVTIIDATRRATALLEGARAQAKIDNPPAA